MVILHFKKNDLNQFLYKSSITKGVDEITAELCESTYTLYLTPL